MGWVGTRYSQAERDKIKRDALKLAHARVMHNWTEVAERFEVGRDTLHNWGRRDEGWYRGMRAAFEGVTDNPSLPVPDLETFRKDYLGHGTPRHQREWFEHIESHDISLILVPPEHGKTTAVGIEYPLWKICQDRNIRVMYVCANQVEARKRLASVQQRLADHDFYVTNGRPSVVADFGPFVPQRRDRTGKAWTSDYFSVIGGTAGEKDYTMQAAGLRGKIYGSRLDIVILDDIVESWVPEGEQERITDWLLGTVQSRVSKDGGKLIIIGTRVHEQDVYSGFLDEANEWSASWAKMVHPAILDEQTKTTLWPDYWPYDELVEKRRKRMRPRDWALRYQQEAIGLPGSPFPLDVLESSKNPSRRTGQLVENLPVIIGVDPATDGNCAIVVLQIDRVTRQRYIVDVIAKAGLGQREAIKSEIIYAARRYGAVRCRVEQNFSQLGDDPDLKMKLHNLRCNLEIWKTDAQNKYDPEWGVLGTAGRFAEGLFDIPAGPGSDSAMRPFIEELALWRAGRKGKQDRVMALWFADLSAEKLGIFRPGLPRRNKAVPGWVLNQQTPDWVAS